MAVKFRTKKEISLLRQELYQFSCRLYVNLQNIYQAKAEADFLVIEQRVRNILKKIGKDPLSISKTTIKSFCRNARKLKVSLESLSFFFLGGVGVFFYRYSLIGMTNYFQLWMWWHCSKSRKVLTSSNIR